MRTFWERLREERKRLILTQDEIAERLGITKQSQGLYERGQRTPNAEYLIGLFELGGDPAYVLTGIRSPQPESSLSPQESELIAGYRLLRAGSRTLSAKPSPPLLPRIKRKANKPQSGFIPPLTQGKGVENRHPTLKATVAQHGWSTVNV